MPVFPRPASAVVLKDDMNRVYLTKRPETMKFFGGYYVFPGGAVEKEDYEIDNNYIKNKPEDDSFEQAHYVAAARELFEEVGILIGSTDDGLTNVPLDKEKEYEYRRLLLKGNISFLQMLKKEGLYLNLENLTYFGHRITSKERPIRFDTRFFIARLPKGQIPKPDLNEVDEATWFFPDEALSAFQREEILLAPPTISALSTIINHQKGSPLMMPKVIR